jgi:HAD superfamily hydrolase (TIGR01509 family)
VRRAIGMGGDKLMPEVSGIDEGSRLGQQISQRRGDTFKSRYLPGIVAFPRVRDLVLRLKDAGYKLAVASSAKEDELDPLLEAAGVSDLIHKRTSSDDADRSKPDPDIVVAALTRVNVDRARAVMIGDTPYDVAAAKRAGIEIVGVECGGWTREALAGAIEVYRDPADLLERYEESVFARL